jgi:uncharacterized repeat protein (TIGR03803 family)
LYGFSIFEGQKRRLEHLVYPLSHRYFYQWGIEMSEIRNNFAANATVKIIRRFVFFITIFTLASLAFGRHASAQDLYSVLHCFGDGSVADDGSLPSSSLVQGAEGNFYGTTKVGGTTASDSDPGDGTAFKMTPTGQITILHNFGDGSVSNDGIYPSAALTLGPDGNFYGTTTESSDGNAGDVFQMTPAGNITILYEFSDLGGDGNNPNSPLVLGANGTFYGTTETGGTAGSGTVYGVTPSGLETILHNFGDGTTTNDGVGPISLLLGTDGNFYGVTVNGGTAGNGTVFQLSAVGFETVLHSFGDGSVVDDGAQPSGLLLGADNNLHGTTSFGGSPSTNGGTVFEITNSGALTVDYMFDQASDQYTSQPLGGLIQAVDGNFYGGTPSALYSMTPGGMLTVLHVFGASTTPDGYYSLAAPVQGTDGSLYGLTSQGGSTSELESGGGIAYKLAVVQPQLIAAPITLPAGLNFFSSPYVYTNQSINQILGYVDVKLAVWSQNDDTYALTPNAPANVIVPGSGYWVRTPRPVTLMEAGQLVSSSHNFTIPLAAGWTSIGDPFLANVSISNLLFDNGTQTFAQATLGTEPLIGSTFWRYDNATNSYIAATTLTPGSAYWVYSAAGTDMQVPHP